MRKVPYPLDKREWHPSLVPGPIALVRLVALELELVKTGPAE